MSEASTPPSEATPEPDLKKRRGIAQPGVKVSAEILARRKEGRLKAMATMASHIEKSGIKRMEEWNNLASSNVLPIPVINQKNYYTEYLKKDDQMMMLRDIKEFNLRLKESKEQKKLEKAKASSNMATPEVGATPTAAPVVAINDDNEDEDEDDEDDDVEFTKVGSDTIIIHPGTTHIRIGLATDVYPKDIPNVIAYPRPVKREQDEPQSPPFPKRTISDDGTVVIDDKDFNQQKATITANFKERMRYYKRRILPNSSEQCFNYNKRATYEEIPEHNDIHKFEYLNAAQLKNEKQYLIGDDALRLDNHKDWLLRSPLKNGDFNGENYNSAQEVLGDLELIIGTVLRDEFQITKKACSSYKVVLIIPDLYGKTYVDQFMSLLLKSLNFGKVAIMQEAVAATFGSGISSACVVDIGSSKTKVSCIDEGMILDNSQVSLDYGGDDITRVLISLLLQNQFPYGEIDLENVHDWRLATELKEKYATFQDADIAIQVYNFAVRNPHQLTKKFELKVFDEVMISAMGLFYPEIFKACRPSRPAAAEKPIFEPHRDYFTGNLDDPGSIAQENTSANKALTFREEHESIQLLSDVIGEQPPLKKPDSTENYTPLDIAIIESISHCSYMDAARMKKLYENILIVGGGSKISGFDNILYDRINIWRSKLLSCANLEEVFKVIDAEKQEFIKNNKNKEKEEVYTISAETWSKIDEIVNDSPILPVEILSSSKDIDPEIMCWKGGSVYGRIKVVNEMMVDYKEYDLLGLRCFQHKSMFNF